MSPEKRKEKRKYKRLEVRYGPEKPVHRAIAIQVSSSGAFLLASKPVFAAGSRILVEFTTPAGTFLTAAIVRHARNLPPEVGGLTRSGMGVQLASPPPELAEYLASL